MQLGDIVSFKKRVAAESRTAGPSASRQHSLPASLSSSPSLSQKSESLSAAGLLGDFLHGNPLASHPMADGGDEGAESDEPELKPEPMSFRGKAKAMEAKHPRSRLPQFERDA